MRARQAPAVTAWCKRAVACVCLLSQVGLNKGKGHALWTVGMGGQRLRSVREGANSTGEVPGRRAGCWVLHVSTRIGSFCLRVKLAICAGHHRGLPLRAGGPHGLHQRDGRGHLEGLRGGEGLRLLYYCGRASVTAAF